MATKEEQHYLLASSFHQHDALPEQKRRYETIGWSAMSFLFGVVCTLLLSSSTTDVSSKAINDIPIMGAENAPALHYYGKASTAFAENIVLMEDRDNSFLSDLFVR